MIIDNYTHRIIKERTEADTAAVERMISRAREKSNTSRLDAPWPSDGLPNMAERVYYVWKMTPKERALTAIMHRDTPPAGLTTHERRNWLDGLSQIGG